jgi:hypothetical protein
MLAAELEFGGRLERANVPSVGCSLLDGQAMTEDQTALKIIDWFRLLRLTTDSRAQEAIQEQIAALYARKRAETAQEEG